MKLFLLKRPVLSTLKMLFCVENINPLYKNPKENNKGPFKTIKVKKIVHQQVILAEYSLEDSVKTSCPHDNL